MRLNLTPDKTLGFSLVETLVAIFVFATGIITVSLVVLYLYRNQAFSIQLSQAIEEAKRGLEIMQKELREARTGEDGSYPIIKAGDFEIIFHANVDQDPKVERVRYFLEGNTLKKGVINPTCCPPRYLNSEEQVSIVSSYVVNVPPIFTYFDALGNELPLPSRLKDTVRIRVLLVINVDPQRPPKDYELQTEITLRNLPI